VTMGTRSTQRSFLKGLYRALYIFLTLCCLGVVFLVYHARKTIYWMKFPWYRVLLTYGCVCLVALGLTVVLYYFWKKLRSLWRLNSAHMTATKNNEKMFEAYREYQMGRLM
ncbi:hypothetical protein KR018_011759, partial [Drosophila ironensis]